MPSFRWSAINSGGEVVHGLSDAADRASVVERLQRQGQIVLRAEPAGRRALADLLHIELVTRRGLDRAALAEVTNELATMLAAGQDLDRALRFVFENAQHAKVRAILGEVRDKVRGGSSLAAALAAEPRSFSRLYVGLVRAGEAGGTLPATLDRLAGLLERERSLKSSLRAALIYPAVLVVAAVGSIVLLLDYVLPQFAPIFEQAGAQLPASTRALIVLGQVVGAATPCSSRTRRYSRQMSRLFAIASSASSCSPETTAAGQSSTRDTSKHTGSWNAPRLPVRSRAPRCASTACARSIRRGRSGNR